MNHNHDLRSACQRFAITGLLVAPVAEVLLVHERDDPQLLRDFNGFVGAGVVDENHLIDHIERQFGVGAFKRRSRVERRHYDGDFFPVQQKAPSNRQSPLCAISGSFTTLTWVGGPT